MNDVKYVVTENLKIIVFSSAINHDTFKYLNPISAGFISIRNKSNGGIVCNCYGKSISLGIKANETRDSNLAKIQILNRIYETDN